MKPKLQTLCILLPNLRPVTLQSYDVIQISCEFLKVNIYGKEKEQATPGRSSP